MVAALPVSFDRREPSFARTPFLQVPPFPGRRVHHFTRLGRAPTKTVSLQQAIALIRAHRVGGSYWACQPAVPQSYLLVRTAAALEACEHLVDKYGEAILWLSTPPSVPRSTAAVVGPCDPWHMLGNARALVCQPDDELRAIAALLHIPTYLVDPSGGIPRRWEGDADLLLADLLLCDETFGSPFGEQALNLVELIELCGFWRSLVDRNRAIENGVGFAFWKQASVLPLLWSGGTSAGFFDAPKPGRSGSVAVWRSKAPAALIDRLESHGTPLVEVEDGFLRSAGLGADCVPPMSITVDCLGPYFDPSRPSELENLLQNGDFPEALLDRARALRETIVRTGLGKYDRSETVIERFDPARRHVLVTGQVEDDRSILTGGGGLVSNLALLKRVRANRPDCFLIYKPHPDVEAGHRKGSISKDIARQYCDLVITDASISSLIAMVDEVHVNTSLAGFEALMRHKEVTTYGVPFYAGWGLTHDLSSVPRRRTSRRSLDELVAATLLLYPRYLDPVSGLPCPAEVVVDRLCAFESRNSLLVSVRRLQGKLKRRLPWLAR